MPLSYSSKNHQKRIESYASSSILSQRLKDSFPPIFSLKLYKSFWLHELFKRFLYVPFQFTAFFDTLNFFHLSHFTQFFLRKGFVIGWFFVLSSPYFAFSSFMPQNNCVSPVQVAALLSKPKQNTEELSKLRAQERRMKRELRDLKQKLSREGTDFLAESLSEKKLGEDPYNVASEIKDYIVSGQNGWDCPPDQADLRFLDPYTDSIQTISQIFIPFSVYQLFFLGTPALAEQISEDETATAEDTQPIPQLPTNSCSASGGQLKDGKCDCSGAKGKTQSSDGKKCEPCPEQANWHEGQCITCTGNKPKWNGHKGQCEGCPKNAPHWINQQCICNPDTHFKKGERCYPSQLNQCLKTGGRLTSNKCICDGKDLEETTDENGNKKCQCKDPNTIYDKNQGRCIQKVCEDSSHILQNGECKPCTGNKYKVGSECRPCPGHANPNQNHTACECENNYDPILKDGQLSQCLKTCNKEAGEIRNPKSGECECDSKNYFSIPLVARCYPKKLEQCLETGGRLTSNKCICDGKDLEETTDENGNKKCQCKDPNTTYNKQQERCIQKVCEDSSHVLQHGECKPCTGNKYKVGNECKRCEHPKRITDTKNTKCECPNNEDYKTDRDGNCKPVEKSFQPVVRQTCSAPNQYPNPDGQGCKSCGTGEVINATKTGCTPCKKENGTIKKNNRCVCIDDYTQISEAGEPLKCKEECESNQDRGRDGECKEKCPRWKTHKAFKNRGYVRPRFCDDYAKQKGQCKEALHNIAKYRDDIATLNNNLDTLKDKISAAKQKTKEEEDKTEATGLCISCLKRVLQASRPSFSETAGHFLKAAMGVGVGWMGYNFGKRAQHEANMLRINDGWDPTWDGFSHAGASVGPPYFEAGLYGMTKPNTPVGGWSCSPAISPYNRGYNIPYFN